MVTFEFPSYNEVVALLQRIRRFAVKVPKDEADADGYSYLRYSTLEQSQGDSVRRQLALRDAWLKRNPHVHLDRYQLLDKGVPSFRGENRKNPKRSLAGFLDRVTRGHVRPGSYLIVENLDRLTREHPKTSIPAVLGLVEAGIKVVQLTPHEVVYDDDMDERDLMGLLWELSRGHGESKRKSGL